MTPIAIVLIHGVEIDDERFADRAIQKLRRHFASHFDGADVDVEKALCVRTVHWAPVLEPRQKELLDKLYEGKSDKLFQILKRLVLRLNTGSVATLLPFALTVGNRKWPWIRGPHYPGLRWLAMHFVGDVIAYQPDGAARANYDAVHGIFAAALEALAREAGPTAPLCVISHSYGTVISSDFFYDLQSHKRTAPTPLEQGKTLSHFYTMGSPMALWALRYAHGLDRPIRVPSPDLEQYHSQLPGEWLNFYDADDVIAFPLKPLGEEYRAAVHRDVNVRLRVPPFSWLPVVHPFYWSDDSVLKPIARSLFEAWQRVNGRTTTEHRAEAAE